MPTLALALSLALVHQVATPLAPPGPATPPPAARPAARPAPFTGQELVPAKPDHAAIYQAAKKLLNEGKAKAMQKDLSLRSRALQANRDAALKTLCRQFDLRLAELLAIIAEGEELDGTADRKAARNSPGKQALRQQNMMMLGAIGAQLDAQAGALAAQSAAQQRAAMNSGPDLRRNAASANAQIRHNNWLNGMEAPWAPRFTGPR